MEQITFKAVLWTGEHGHRSSKIHVADRQKDRQTHTQIFSMLLTRPCCQRSEPGQALMGQKKTNSLNSSEMDSNILECFIRYDEWHLSQCKQRRSMKFSQSLLCGLIACHMAASTTKVQTVFSQVKIYYSAQTIKQRLIVRICNLVRRQVLITLFVIWLKTSLWLRSDCRQMWPKPHVLPKKLQISFWFFKMRARPLRPRRSEQIQARFLTKKKNPNCV